MTECYFVPDKKLTSATICANCGKEKALHTIGDGIKASEIIIKTTRTANTQVEDKGDNDFLITQFPGKGGSDIHEQTSEQEIDEIAQWINNEKYQPEFNLWAEVAKEFHFDKPFHNTAVRSITQRLIDKGFKISKQR